MDPISRPKDLTIVRLALQRTSVSGGLRAFAGANCHLSGPFKDASFATINPGKWRGDHVHPNHDELFFIQATGRWSFRYTKALTGTTINNKPAFTTNSTADVLYAPAGFYSVFVPKGTAHTLVNEETLNDQNRVLRFIAFVEPAYVQDDNWAPQCPIHRFLSPGEFDKLRLQTEKKIGEDFDRLQSHPLPVLHAAASFREATFSARGLVTKSDTAQRGVTTAIPEQALDFQQAFRSLTWNVCPRGGQIKPLSSKSSVVLLIVEAATKFYFRIGPKADNLGGGAFQAGVWTFRIPAQSIYEIDYPDSSMPTEPLQCLEMCELDSKASDSPKVTMPLTRRARQVLQACRGK